MNKELYDLSYSLRKARHQKVASVVAAILLAFVAVNLLLNFVIFPNRQLSLSMQGDFKVGDCVMCSPLARNFPRGSIVITQPLERNRKSLARRLIDSVILFITGRQITLDAIEGFVGSNGQIRRVVGVPGDTIYMRDYVLYIQPKGEKYFLTEFELIRRPYQVFINTNPALWDNTVGVSGSFEKYTLESDEYFLLADTRNSSLDSRLWGAVKAADIKGRVLLTYFPLNHLKIW